MKKLIAALVLGASICLTACGPTVVKSSTTKEKLEKASYTVEVYGATEAKARIIGLEFTVDIEDALFAVKNGKEVLLACYCKNNDDATKILEDNIQVLNAFITKYTEEPKQGSYNNVAYVGTPTAVSDAGFQKI